jgi:hypothetical protein
VLWCVWATRARDERAHTCHPTLTLTSLADYLGDVEDAAFAQEVAFKLYLAAGAYADALRTALRLGGALAHDRVKTVFAVSRALVTRAVVARAEPRPRHTS